MNNTETAMTSRVHRSLLLLLAQHVQSMDADQLTDHLLLKHGAGIVHWPMWRVFQASAEAVDNHALALARHLRGMERADAQRDHMLDALRLRDFADRRHPEVNLIDEAIERKFKDWCVVLLLAGVSPSIAFSRYSFTFRDGATSAFYAGVQEEARRQKAAAFNAAWQEAAPSPARARL